MQMSTSTNENTAKRYSGGEIGQIEEDTNTGGSMENSITVHLNLIVSRTSSSFIKQG